MRIVLYIRPLQCSFMVTIVIVTIDFFASTYKVILKIWMIFASTYKVIPKIWMIFASTYKVIPKIWMIFL